MRHQRPIFIISAIAASSLALTGCGELIHSVPPPAIYVTTGTPSQILAFSSNVNGNPSPVSAITLPSGFAAGYIAGDTAGNLYVSTSSDIREYPAGATGSAAPTRILPADATTTIANITGFTADSAGNLYVSEFNAGIAIFSGTANGSVAPARFIRVGGSSGLMFPEALATDSAGNLYVANFSQSGQGSVFVFGPTANGDVAPARILNVATTGMAVDRSGNLFTTANGGIAVFGPQASGNATPIRTIRGTDTGFARFTGGIALDADANIYVVTWGTLLYNALPVTPTILQFSASASGNTAPTNAFTPTTWTPAIPVLAVH
jgi:hypothetical protein